MSASNHLRVTIEYPAIHARQQIQRACGGARTDGPVAALSLQGRRGARGCLHPPPERVSDWPRPKGTYRAMLPHTMGIAHRDSHRSRTYSCRTRPYRPSMPVSEHNNAISLQRPMISTVIQYRGLTETIDGRLARVVKPYIIDLNR